MEQERCDRCGAAAQVQLILPNGQDLVFCGHHGREYKDKILDIASEVIYNDETMMNDLQPA